MPATTNGTNGTMPTVTYLEDGMDDDISPSTSSTDATTDFQKAFEAVLESGLHTKHHQNGNHSSARVRQQPDFVAIVQLHQLVSAHQLRAAKPASLEAVEILTELLANLKRNLTKTSSTSTGKNVSSNESQTLVDQLVSCLKSPTISALIAAHDDLANRRFEPVLPEIPHEVDEDEGVAIKIVRLVRNNEPLGATIKCEQDGSVVIARVMKGGVADRSACIQVGDRVIEVNGVTVTGKQPKEIVKLLADNSKTVTFKLVPTQDNSDYANMEEPSISNPRVRCLFDYNAADDPLNPCPEAGLSFRKGDILELVDCHDAHWWQATRESNPYIERTYANHSPSAEQKVGLVPSRGLQERRSQCADHSPSQSPQSLSSRSDTLDSRRSNRLKKIMYDTSGSEKLDAAVLTYENVALLYPRSGLIRPVVLVGPPGVGRNELQRRLLMLNPEKYATTVPHTSRPPKVGEIDGVDYWFASKQQMETWVKQGRFIEYGEYKDNIYGTLGDSIEALMQKGRTPVLTPHPQALKLLRTPLLRPYIVYVKPPPFPALKESRTNLRARSIKDGSYGRGFSDDELKAMLSASNYLEQQYAHLFDYVLVNGSLEFAFRELCECLTKLETQPQWAPESWLR